MKSIKNRANRGDGVVLIKYEPKLNKAWEDPLPRTNSAVVHFTGTPLVTRRSEVTTHLTHTRHNNNFAAKQPPSITLGNNSRERKRLEHTPSARTVSSEDSWCSEGVASDRELSSDEDDDSQLSDRSSITSTSQRNSQLRLTFNKAKQHLSFDKWRNSNSTNNNPPAVTPTGANNNSLNNSQTSSGSTTPSSTVGMPSVNNESPTIEPFSRLSRWFSIRRGSTHQYDVDKGRESRAASAEPDTTDSSNRSSTISAPTKMPQLNEDEETQAFTNGLLNGSARNGTAVFAAANGSLKVPPRPIAPALPPAPAGLSQQALKRRHIVAAIVHSENSYVATLQRLVNDYKKPLEESNPPILSSTKIATLFHRLPEILHCHNMFRIALADCVRNWDRDEKIGDVFVTAFTKPIVLDIYSGFINNFSVAMDLAKMEAKRKSALADFFKVKQISAHDRLSFFGLMVKPVQRFPQFILFLQDLLKYTPQGHEDRMSLQLALTQLESLAEMLNERKREAEQYQAFREMLGHISSTFNVRSLAATSNDGTRQRYLLREDNVTLLEFNTSGFIVKSKQRRLLLLNDRIICVSVAPKQSADFGSTEKLSFKWMHPVTDVEIVDNSTSATLSRILTAGMNKGGSLRSNSSFGESNSGSGGPTSGADNLCTEMSNLMHDYEVMSRINDLVGTLKGNYKDLNLEVTRKLLSTIQTSIQKKDEEMAWVDSCCMQIVVKNKSGKEETFTFQTENPTVKKEWITELRLAQLALDTNNSPAWKIPENEHVPLTKMPLFVRSQPVYKSQQQTEVRCGCYYSTTCSNVRLSTKQRNKSQNYLWLCSTDGTSSHIALFSQHHQQAGVLKDIASFDLVEVTVTAMEYVKGMPSQTMYSDTSANEMTALDCVWIATDNKKILLYLANNPNVPEQVAHCSIPSVANQILYHMDNVFVALICGTVLIFRKNSDLLWNLKDFQSVPLSSQELITSLIPINGNVYAACGKKVWVINGYNGEVGRSFDVQLTNSATTVNLMAHSGIGLWISLKNSSVICLYHTETFKHLQNINIAMYVLRVTSSQRSGSDNNNSSVFVTALMACKGLLWVGTNVGIALTIPLPRLEGVPIISGAVNISYHAHFGPITFFLPLLTRNYNFPSAPAKVEAIAPATPEPEDKKDASPKKELDSKKLPVSPVIRRRRVSVQDMARISKTLPRGLGSAAFFNHMNSPTNSVHQSDHTCDVYGLYGDLIFVKDAEYDAEEGQGCNLMESNYETLHRSDPELAAIPGKVSTLDRRLRMKVSRPRSLDLSNWSVDSRSSSMYTSSGSEESMGIKMFGGSSSVSRNSSNASGHKYNTELTNISEHKVDDTPAETPSTPAEEQTPNEPPSTSTPATAQTLKRAKKAKVTQPVQEVQGRRTILTLMGGRGYINWRHIWNANQDVQKGHSRSNSISVMPKVQNHTDAHIIIWEKKL